MKPTSEATVMNTDYPREYWEQGFAPVKRRHPVDSQSNGDKENREFSCGKYNS